MIVLQNGDYLMLATVQSAFKKFGGQSSPPFMGRQRSNETGENSLMLCANGNLYKLEGLLGTGGMSIVYRASRFSDGKEVALKVANLKKAPEAGALIQREAEFMARLDHPNIVKMIDSGTTVDGSPYIAMEILQGQTLEQLLICQTNLDLERVSAICLQVAEAVQHAHEHGVLHRDIKPSNIMLVERDGIESAVLYDFGISLTVDEDGRSYEESSAGSLLYASPEQLLEERCSYSTDVYQLALVMFEALTGRLPFEISVAGALNYRRGNGPLLLSDEELGTQRLDNDIRKVLEGALERNPRQRTRNMTSFMQGLKLALCQPGIWSFSTSMA